MNDNACPFFLQYMPMEVSLVSLEDAQLPNFLGSTLRGVIGQVLYKNQNVYKYLYHNGMAKDKIYDAVNPYIIVPPQCGQGVYKRGDVLKFKIILIGDAVQYARDFVLAVREIADLGLGAFRYKFCLNKIIHCHDQRVIWQNENFYENHAFRKLVLPCWDLSDVRGVKIEILTPLRIRRNGQLLERLDFVTLIRNIVRRMEMLTERYGGSVNKDEAIHIQQLAAEIQCNHENLKIADLNRYSNRLGRKMDFSGLVGKISFHGDLTPFVPWLYAAQIVHIGRNTTFGMGQIYVEYI